MSLLKPFVSLTLTLALVGCATPPQLSLGPQGKASLTNLPRNEAHASQVVDQRTSSDKLGTTSPGLIWLGDDQLSPAPADALDRELKYWSKNASQGSGLDRSGLLALKSFEVAIQWRDSRNDGYPGATPGIAAVDYLARTAALAGKQLSFAMTLRIVIERDGELLKVESSGLHTDDGRPLLLAPLLRNAAEKLATRLVPAAKTD